MARSIWSGSISFGLVNIPVKLFTAVSQKEVHFNMLHEKDGSRVSLKRFCVKENKEIPWDEIAKGYQVAPGRYVMVTKEELEAFDPRATKTIEITDFVELSEIDPVYYEHTYYLAPDRGAGKAYALLLEAMKRTGKVGIARVVLRTKQYLCALRPIEGNALAMSTMQYADEIVSTQKIEALKDLDAKPSEKELRMAEQLVEALTAKWEPDKYKDEYRERVLEMLERKAEGEEIVAAEEPEEKRGKVVNLADALAASLKAKSGDWKAAADADDDDDEEEEEEKPKKRAGRKKK